MRSGLFIVKVYDSKGKCLLSFQEYGTPQAAWFAAERMSGLFSDVVRVTVDFALDPPPPKE